MIAEMSVANTGRRAFLDSRSWVFLAAAGCLLALGLQIVAVYAHSLSGDGAHHLIAGHQALRYGQNTLNLEHPPLVKLVAGLPLLFEEPPEPPLRVEDALAAARLYTRPQLLKRATVRGRCLVQLLQIKSPGASSRP